ncbi:sentrin-specific protease 7 isoform X7 [Delphinus delphis]|uniref:sentrin-specific protease 7 isoform X7 n=1 Tax=Delphinus delphis TaxID=9728 RepID=UPI0028C4370F|nr:sentrin-specific protease 7 isoform X7 [Delphinus delphis]
MKLSQKGKGKSLHLWSYIRYIKNTSTCGTAVTAHLLNAGRRPQTSQKIKKMLNAKPEDVCVKSPLSKLRSSERWDLSLQGWKRSLRNKVLSVDHKSKKGVRGRPVTSKTSAERQLKVMLTNVLWTDLGRKFRKTLPKNDANLCDANKVQSDSLPSTSVDSLETCQKLEPLHQSLNLSERSSQPSQTDNNYAKQAAHTKEKRRDDDSISLVMSDTQPKG